MTNQQETLKERMARVRSHRKPPAGAVITTDQEFAAVHANSRVRSTTPVEGEKAGLTEAGVVTHTRPDTVTMYKPTPQGKKIIYTARQVPVTSIQVNLLNGWRAHCPHCGGDHGAELNACPALEPVKYRICPICGKEVGDTRVSTGYVESEEDDNPNVIRDDAYASTTPEMRTKAALDLHIWRRHEQEAREMGLPALVGAETITRSVIGVQGV